MLSQSQTKRLGVYLGRHASELGGIAVYCREFITRSLEILNDSDEKDISLVVYGDGKILTGDFLKFLESEDHLFSLSKSFTSSITGPRACRYLVQLPNGSKCNVLIRVLPSYFNHKLGLIADQFLLPFVLIKDRISVVHSLANLCLIFSPAMQIVTVHDLYQAWPPALIKGKDEKDRGILQRIYTIFFKKQFAKVCRVFVDSLEVADEIKSKFSYPSEFIEFIPLGIDRPFLKYLNENKSEGLGSWKQERQLPEKFTLLLASGNPRKNTRRSIIAWNKLADSNLVINLSDKAASVEVEKALRSENIDLSRVKVIEGLDRSEIPRLIAASSVVLMPTLAEGFGLPILEAIAVGSRVVCGPLKYFSSDNQFSKFVFFCDPYDVNDIVDKLKQAISNIENNNEIVSVREMSKAVDDSFLVYNELMQAGFSRARRL